MCVQPAAFINTDVSLQTPVSGRKLEDARVENAQQSKRNHLFYLGLIMCRMKRNPHILNNQSYILAAYILIRFL